MTAPRCLACGANGPVLWASAEDVEYHTTSEPFAFYRCDACAALSIHPVPADRLGLIYPSSYYSYAEPGKSLVHAVKSFLDRRFFRSILARVPGERLRALDVGGGAGWELSAVRSSDPRIQDSMVVDLDPNAAELAKANGHRYFCGRIEDFESDESFDLVLLLNVIEHVQDPVRVLEKVRALLSPGGVALLKTPNYDAFDARVFRHQSWAGYHCPRHWVLFTKESFTRAAERAGLGVRVAEYTQGAPFWAASTLAWLARRGLARVDRERPVVYHPLFQPLAALFAAFDFARRPFAKTSQMFFVLGRNDVS